MKYLSGKSVTPPEFKPGFTEYKAAPLLSEPASSVDMKAIGVWCVNTVTLLRMGGVATSGSLPGIAAAFS
jgi:hypothetical protein